MITKFNMPAKRMEKVYASVPRKILERARQLEKEGRKIIHLELGEPDFNTPAPIVESTVDALRNSKTHYESNRGNTMLRQKIAEDICRSQGLRYDPDEEILMAAGVAPGIFYSILAYIGKGDEVITFEPEFMNYDIDIMLAGGTNVPIVLCAENGFQIDPSEVEKAITPRTKMMIINNPHNPTGVVHKADILERLAKLAVQYDLLVVTDEVYEKIVYDGVKAVSIAAFPGMRQRTILLNGFSKAYAMTGWRMGYIAADAGLMTPILRIHQYLATCIPTFTQAGLAERMDDPMCIQDIDHMVSVFQERRDLVVSMLEGIPNIAFVKPQGAFYLMVDISKTGLTGMEFAGRLLEEENVALSPACAFGKSFDDYIRISYATSKEELITGLTHIGYLVEKLTQH